MRDSLERYFVYILRCSDDSYYTGVTNNVERRLREHQEGLDGVASYTFRRRPVELVFRQGFREIFDAIAWEKQIKGWSRKKKEALICGDFDLLPKLSYNAMVRRIRSVQRMVVEVTGDVMGATEKATKNVSCRAQSRHVVGTTGAAM